MRKITDFDDYRQIIKQRVAANGKVRGYQKSLASAAGCKPSYFSKAMSGDCELTPDHAAGLCRFWDLNTLESYYFLETVNLSRAGSKALKDMTRQRLQSLREELSDLGKRLSLPSLEAHQAEYYADWMMAAVHVMTSVPGHTHARKIAAALNLSEDSVQTALTKLADIGVVEKAGREQWRLGRGSIHAPKGSPYAWLHLANWRQRALVHAQREDTGFHFTSVYSLSREDKENLRRLLEQFVGTCNQLLANSKEETVACVNLDLFGITSS